MVGGELEGSAVVHQDANSNRVVEERSANEGVSHSVVIVISEA